TAVTLSGQTLSGVFGSDAVSLSGGAASFDSKNAGTQGVTATGFGLSGADAGNYTLTSTTATTSAVITPLALTATISSAADKVYDGTTSATVTLAPLSGFIA